MMFRPATPLTVLLLAAFVLLLLSVLSAPIIKSINVASFGGVKFGVFGWCGPDECSSVSLGYNMDQILQGEKNTDFSLPSKARNSLTNLLIAHPIAAFMTLVLLVLSLLAHLHTPAHSPKYLLALLILALPTLLVSLLAFLVDILIFFPHLQWGGWIVLAATILIVISGIVMCGIRRQVVGRIARSKRIQENAEMNGQNYYARQAAVSPAEPEGKLPEFATFEVMKSGPSGSEPERIPLNPRVQPENQGFQRSNTVRTDMSDRSNYGPPPRGNGPIGAGGVSMRTQPSNQTLPSSMSGSSYGPSRPPPGPRYGPTPPPLNQGYPPPMPAGFDGPSGPPRGYGSPPPGMGGPGRGLPPRGPPGPPGPGGFDPRIGPPYPGYGPPPGPPRGPTPNNYGPGGYGPPPRNAAASPAGGVGPRMGPGPGMGMAAAGGLRAPPPRRPVPPQPQPYEEPEFPAGIENNTTDERQEFDQTLAPVHPEMIGRALSVDGGRDNGEGPSSPQELPAGGDSAGKLAVVNENRPTYEEEPYIPPRAQWQANNPPAPVELSAERSQVAGGSPSRSGSSKSKRASDLYYEDVAPQFDSSTLDPNASLNPPSPDAYTAGNTSSWNTLPPDTPTAPDGPRSPTMSTISGFTSVSQRGINPRWQEEQARLGGGRGVAPRKSVGLAGNPDFELPAIAGNRGRGRGRGIDTFR